MTPWILNPLVPGQWRDLTAEEEREFAFVYSGSWAALQPGLERDFSPQQCRARRLACYRSTVLIELQATLPALGEVGIMDLLYAPDRLVILDGSSSLLHELNEIPGMLTIDSDASALDYVHLFCNAMLADEGRFEVITDLAQLRVGAGQSLSAEVIEVVERGAVIECRHMPEHWVVGATMRYGSGIFRTDLYVAGSGGVEMVNDEIITEDAGVLPDRRHVQFRLAAPVAL